MKTVRRFKSIGTGLCIIATFSAYAQSSAVAPAISVPPQVAAKSSRAADHKLDLDVRRALRKARGLDSTNIFVRTRAGTVTLLGTVPNDAQISRAGEVAKGVAGVSSVTNKLSLTAAH
jgi:osmotically-inducible protein OsmY